MIGCVLIMIRLLAWTRRRRRSSLRAVAAGHGAAAARARLSRSAEAGMRDSASGKRLMRGVANGTITVHVAYVREGAEHALIGVSRPARRLPGSVGRLAEAF